MGRSFVRSLVCERCGHEWVPRVAGSIPLRCARCGSPYWDRPRKRAPRTAAPS